MAFTPPCCSLDIDRSQDEPVLQDHSPVAFAFPAGMAPMMAQPMVEGRKAIKFVEPISKVHFFCAYHFLVYICVV